jgi:hypothetical protein
VLSNSIEPLKGQVYQTSAYLLTLYC